MNVIAFSTQCLGALKAQFKLIVKIDQAYHSKAPDWHRSVLSACHFLDVLLLVAPFHVECWPPSSVPGVPEWPPTPFVGAMQSSWPTHALEAPSERESANW